ncbi:hypothetical protein GJ496_004138 [Pomphorhynchus laevis]|nr:hypothetical protein GJ496_004138 [Pomphorhynchus laevis]
MTCIKSNNEKNVLLVTEPLIELSPTRLKLYLLKLGKTTEVSVFKYDFECDLNRFQAPICAVSSTSVAVIVSPNLYLFDLPVHDDSLSWSTTKRTINVGGHKRLVHCAFAGKYLVLSDRDNKIWFIDCSILRISTKPMSAHFSIITDLLVPNPKLIFAAERDMKVRVSSSMCPMDINAYLLGHEGAITSITCCFLADNNQNERFVASASLDGSIKIWDCTDFRCLISHDTSDPIRMIVASSDGLIACAYYKTPKVDVFRWVDGGKALHHVQTIKIVFELYAMDFIGRNILYVAASSSERSHPHVQMFDADNSGSIPEVFHIALSSVSKFILPIYYTEEQLATKEVCSNIESYKLKRICTGKLDHDSHRTDPLDS